MKKIFLLICLVMSFIFTGLEISSVYANGKKAQTNITKDQKEKKKNLEVVEQQLTNLKIKVKRY